MWANGNNHRGGKNSITRLTGNELVAIGISHDKASQNALVWAVDHLIPKGKTLVLIHVVHTFPRQDTHASLSPSSRRKELEKFTKNLFLTFHCYCTRKDIQCLDVVLEDTDVARALAEYVANAAIQYLILGTSSHPALMRFKAYNVPSNVTKSVPDFCTVYVISKGKVSTVRHASRAIAPSSPIMDQIDNLNKQRNSSERKFSHSVREKQPKKPVMPPDDSIRSPFTMRKGFGGGYHAYDDITELETDISFVSSGRPSSDRTSYTLPYDFDGFDSNFSSSTSESFSNMRLGGGRYNDMSPVRASISISPTSTRTSVSSAAMDDIEAEMRRLKLELKQTMDMYSTACREALNAKEKAAMLQHGRLEDERKLEEARNAQEVAAAVVETEKAKVKAANEAAEAAQRVADLEAQKRMKALHDTAEMKKALYAMNQNDTKYRRYSIEELETATEFFAASNKIGEGGYGPVFRCYLDHTLVAVKVLRPDAAQGRAQFQQEIDILSRIRHPNMVLLVGACPEYGCIVYEYMANGSLEDRLFRRGNNNAPILSWRLRFRIASEIATALSFLHQTKPEPLVHRDLKPANVLLDSNYVSKIGDVGLARLVPPSVAESITQCCVTAAAGTFCYIDPEYQQTGMLGVKSDVYSYGILLLQLLTGKPPMGITHVVEMAIENDNLSSVLDSDVKDWPLEEVMELMKLGLQCAEMKRKDRPDLGKVVVPELNRLRKLAEKDTTDVMLGTLPYQGNALSGPQEVFSDHLNMHSESSCSNSTTSLPG